MKTIAPTRAPYRFFCSMFFAAALLPAPLVSAQVNKCVDTGGKVVGYGSQCPAGTRAEPTGIRNAPSAPAPGAAKSLAEQDAEFRKRQTEKQDTQVKTDKAGAEAQERASACDSARSYLTALQLGTRIVRTDPKTGERVVLGDADRATETAAAQRAADANCK